MRQTGNKTSQATKQEYYLLCVTENKELFKKVMAFANEIIMGIVAPLTLTFLRKNCVKSKNVYMNVSSLNLNYWTHFEPRTKSAMLMPFMTVARSSLLAICIIVSI